MDPILSHLEIKKLSRKGIDAEPELTAILSLDMIEGSLQGLEDQSSIMINQSMAKAIFGDIDPINKILKIDNKKQSKSKWCI